MLLRQTRPRVSVTLDLLVPRVSAVRSRIGGELAPPAGSSGLIVTGIQDSLPPPIKWLYPLKARREGRWKPGAPRRRVRQPVPDPARTPGRPFESRGRADQPASLQCTGGTTGTPKAAVLTHRNLVANAVQSEAGARGRAGSTRARWCARCRYFHIYG